MTARGGRTEAIAADEFLAAARLIARARILRAEIEAKTDAANQLYETALAHLAVVDELSCTGEEMVEYWRERGQDDVAQHVLEATRELLASHLSP